MLASGDIYGFASALAVWESTGAAAVMLARGVAGNPWSADDLLAGEDRPRPPLAVVVADLRALLARVAAERGAQRAARWARKLLGWYLRPSGVSPGAIEDLRQTPTGRTDRALPPADRKAARRSEATRPAPRREAERFEATASRRAWRAPPRGPASRRTVAAGDPLGHSRALPVPGKACRRRAAPEAGRLARFDKCWLSTYNAPPLLGPFASGVLRRKVPLVSRKEVLLTADGLKQLQDEIAHLSTYRREEVAERIRQAREFGDISENSEYDDAKSEQAMLSTASASCRRSFAGPG